MKDTSAQFTWPQTPDTPRRVRCLNPFRWIEINDGGEVTPCCSPWFKGSLGNINEQSLEDIWHGERFRQAREAMYPGGNWGRFCNTQTCPHIINDNWVEIDAISTGDRDIVPIVETTLDDVRRGRTDPTVGPVQIGISCDARCNLRCIMCSSLTNPHRDDGALLRKALKGVEGFLPTLHRLKMMGDGEVFAAPEAREFLFGFDAGKYPDLSFLIHTNAMLLTPATWERIRHVPIDWLVVSIDAATKATYEKIRRGGRWETLRANLEFLAERYRAGRIAQMHLSMCVMKSNHREMVAFAEMARRLGVTSAYYQPILGDYGAEQIFGRHDVTCLRRIARQLDDPALKRPGVDTSALVQWRGWRPGWRDYARCLRRRARNWMRVKTG